MRGGDGVPTFQPGARLDDEAHITVLDPMRRVNAALLDLLRTLTDEDWRKPTVHPDRSVKDLAAHMLHGCLRSVTGDRDDYDYPMPPIAGLDDLIGFIQQDNREFMRGMRRISPQVLIELIALYDPQVVTLFEQGDPDEMGCGVGWAGEDQSRRWFGIAREYTEKWHHQAQLRLATGRPLLYGSGLFEPVLETFARGLPFAFRRYVRPEGSQITVSTTGVADLGWTLRRETGYWSLWSGADAQADVRLSLPAEVAWQVWTKTIGCGEAREQVACFGDQAAADTLVRFVAIMA
jgi:uncharacterized protein (TIGR03083 family)